MVDEHTHDQAVEHGDCGGFRRGEHAAVDTAEDNDGHQKAPEGILERLQALLAAGHGQDLKVHLAAHEHGGHDQTESHQKAGYNTGDEQIRDGGVRDGAVHNEGDGRRDDDADPAARGHQRAGKRSGIAGLDERRDHDEAQSRDRCRTRTGNSSEEAGDDHADHRHAAADVTEALFRQIDEAAGDTGLLHHVAGQDEKRDGQQDKLTARRRAQTGQNAHDGLERLACALHKDRAHAGHTEADRDRCAERQQQYKNTQ